MILCYGLFKPDIDVTRLTKELFRLLELIINILLLNKVRLESANDVFLLTVEVLVKHFVSYFTKLSNLAQI